VNGKQRQLSSDEWVVVRNTHEPIVSEELWESAQAATRQNSNTYGINHRKKNTNKGENILQGVLICPNCNSPMQLRVDAKYGHKHYVCIVKLTNPNCTTDSIKESVLLNTIFSAIKKEIATAADIRKILDKLSKSKGHLDNLNRLQQSIRGVNLRISRNSSLRGSLFDTYGDGLITEHEFKEMKDNYTDEAERLQSELSGYEKEHDRLSSIYTKDNKHIASLLKFKKQKTLTREMLIELVEKITVYGSDRIEILWRFDDEYRALGSLAKAGGQ